MIDGQRAALSTTETAVIASNAQLIPFGIRVRSSIGTPRAAYMLRPALVLPPAFNTFWCCAFLIAAALGTLALLLSPFRIGFVAHTMPIALPSAHIVRVLVFLPCALFGALCIGLSCAAFSLFFRCLAATGLNTFAVVFYAVVDVKNALLRTRLVRGIGRIAILALGICTHSAPGRAAIAGLFGRREVIERLLNLTFCASFHKNSISRNCFYEDDNLMIARG